MLNGCNAIKAMGAAIGDVLEILKRPWDVQCASAECRLLERASYPRSDGGVAAY
ncbi:MAG: hypothetical protein JWR22_2163 [Herminiimonas sp.]|nr:hypothetical protein [Herminiimonas sp.]